MILNIMKQTIHYHIEEKEFQIANIYAHLYSKMVIQFSRKKEHAIMALKHLAFEFFSMDHFRNAKKYYQEIKKNFGIEAFKDIDLIRLATANEKLNQYNEAIIDYETVLRLYPDSSHISKVCQNISHILEICHNKNKAKLFKKLSIRPQTSRIKELIATH